MRWEVELTQQQQQPFVACVSASSPLAGRLVRPHANFDAGDVAVPFGAASEVPVA